MIATNTHAAKLKIVVLAAGFSSRLGSPKALARVHGVSLLRRTVRAAAGIGAAGIIVVVPATASRYGAELRQCKVTLVRNRLRHRGLSSSVRSGLKHAWYCSAVLLLPADLPHLKRAELHRLVSLWRAAPGRVHATRVGTSGGAPLILPKRFFRRALRVAGDAGLRGLIAELASTQRELVEVPSARMDVDTVQDLNAARRRWT